MAEFILSKRGAIVLVENGYRYLTDKREVRDGKWRWRCELYRDKQCHATLYTDSHVNKDEQPVIRERLGQVHTHGSNAAKIEVEKFKASVKKRAAETQESTSTVVQLSIGGMSAEANSQIKIEAMKRTCRRQRQFVGGHPVAPPSRRELHIPAEMVNATLSGAEENVLKWDSGQGDDRILLFSTRRHLRLLGDAQEWCCDGTFDAAPSLFAQLYTVHARVAGSMQPLVYCLLPDKSQATMVRMFAQVRLQIINIQSSIIQTPLTIVKKKTTYNTLHEIHNREITA